MGFGEISVAACKLPELFRGDRCNSLFIKCCSPSISKQSRELYHYQVEVRDCDSEYCLGEKKLNDFMFNKPVRHQREQHNLVSSPKCIRNNF